MRNLLGGFMQACLIASLLLAGTAGASAFAISSVHLVNLTGQPLGANQSQAQWTFNASFNSTGAQIRANISAGDINYTDPSGRGIIASSPLEVIGSVGGQGTAYYAINTLAMIPVQEMSSYVTLGSVYQGYGPYQNGTSAAACNPSGIYAEWDFYEHVQPSTNASYRNVVVGRVCIYNQTVGWAEALPAEAVAHPTANITLITSGAQESVAIPDNASHAASADGLAKAWWIGSPGVQLQGQAAPNGTAYVAVEGSSSGSWYLQSNSVFSKWYRQFYKFTRTQISSINQQYSPSSVGILSGSCNVVSVTHLTNQSIASAITCMNSTAAVYYSLSNQQAARLISSSAQNLSGYQYSEAALGSGPAIAIDLAAGFVARPQIGFELSGQFLGYALPAAAPQILMVNASPVTLQGSGTLTMLVENYGNSRGLFNVSITGCPGIKTTSGAGYYAGPGQVVNVTAAFTAPNSNLTLDRQCSVQVSGEYGGGNSKVVNFLSETPNQYLRMEFQGVRNAVCNSDGIFTQMLCQYFGIGYG